MMTLGIIFLLLGLSAGNGGLIMLGLLFIVLE